MYKSQLDLTPGTEIRLPACDDLDVDESCHIIDEDSLLAINATLATARPLLVRGEPGVGKSQLARAAAVALGRAFVPHAIDARTETRDLLWSVDAVARLAEAQLVGALRKVCLLYTSGLHETRPSSPSRVSAASNSISR